MKVPTSLFLALILTMLTSCAPTTSKSQSVADCVDSEVIQSFAPSEGVGASYSGSGELRFNYTLACAGYVTLKHADGTVLYPRQKVSAGANTLPSAKVDFQVMWTEPFGREVFILEYTSSKAHSNSTVTSAETWLMSEAE